MAENTPNENQKAKSDDVSLLAVDSAETSAALDALFQDQTGTKPADPTPEEKAAADTKAKADAAAADEAAKSRAAAESQSLDDSAAKAAADEKAAADAAAAKTADADKAAADAKAKADADKAAADANTPAPVKDAFDDITLPEGVKPKSSESFERVKTLAKQATTELRAEVAKEKAAREAAELKAADAAKALEAAAKTTIAPEVEAELKDLRLFKISKEVESDPRLKEFDGKITANDESIYKKLVAAGMSDVSINQIKELGGPAKVDWDPIMEKLPLQTRRSIEATLLDTERQAEARAEALEKAKAEGSSYLEQRAVKEVAEMTDTANGFLKDLPWTKEQAIPANATPEQRAAIEAGNNFAKESVNRLKAFLSDRSPAKVAELAVGTLIAYRNKADLEAVTAKLATVETAHATALKDLTDKLAAATKEKEKLAQDLLEFRRAENPLGRGANNLVSTPPKKGVDDIRSGAEALDAIAAEVSGAEN